MIRRALGAEVLRRRNALGLVQRDVWQRANLAKNVYLRIERAERTAAIHQLIAIADALEVGPAELLTAALDRIDRGDVAPRRGTEDEWRSAPRE
ncbi:helix-turn-helix domain-containing protein [Nocardia sp. NPDC052566]|uniref:helix-turn-helix domain-containing protein n=1 Tax=Nocardia sp. NPDC052566 TaxID=3364330 RepID=UPI0037C9E520